ncbi:hypothetical protein H6503_02190 [Candidatus Woesearchaeota archaeon]|nr:hypothetical protein [Candidatus Woesearchaeota archaeon]
MDSLRYSSYLLIMIVVFIALDHYVQSQDDKNAIPINIPGSYSYSFFSCRTSDCEEVFIELIEDARYSIRCAFFELELTAMIDSMDNSQAEKTIILDDRNSIHRQYVIYDNRSGYMHNKFCIIDNSTVITGSFNPTENGKLRNDNNVLVIDSSKVAKIYDDYFNMMIDEYRYGETHDDTARNNFLDGGNMEICFSRGGNCLAVIHKYLKNASLSIEFMLFTATDDWIADILSIKNMQGLEIDGIMENRMISSYSMFDKLRYQDIDVIKDCNPATMHHKVFIIDDSIVITGSFNPSDNADNNNDENMIVIHDKLLAIKYLNELQRIRQLCTT